MDIFFVTGLVVVTAAAIRGMWSPCGLSMISTITPMTERSRGHRFWATATWYIVGATVGGATLGAAMFLGALAVSATGLSPEVRILAVWIAALVCVASDLELFGFRLPTHPRQVNETWLGTHRRWAYASGFGWQIGSGFATYIMTAAMYLVAAIGVLSADPLVALVMGTAFGLVRGSCVLVASGVDRPERLSRLHARIDGLATASLDAVLGIQIVILGLLARSLDSIVLAVLTILVAGLVIARKFVDLGRRGDTAVAASPRPG